jgi:hypothetical protein
MGWDYQFIDSRFQRFHRVEIPESKSNMAFADTGISGMRNH